MKALLGCLMCLVLTLSQAFAISGGPFGLNVVGTYAGAFVPTPVIVDPGPPPVTLPPDNSLGIFSVAIAPHGLGIGQNADDHATIGSAFIFRNGLVYAGWPAVVTQPPLPPTGGSPGIIGSADPLTGQLKAIVSTRVVNGLPTGDAVATGKFDSTRIDRSSNLLGAMLIRGKAHITYISSDPRGDSGGAIQYRVRGFKQSDSTSF